MPYFNIAIDENNLNVEPGAYQLMARSMSGVFGSWKYASEPPRDERVRVEGRRGGHRHHLAGASIEHHHRAALGRVAAPGVGAVGVARTVDALLERLLGDRLGVEIDAELHVVSGHRLAVTWRTLVTWPALSTSTLSTPGVPRSSVSYLSSMPSLPISSSTAYLSFGRAFSSASLILPMYPSTCAAAVLFGYSRTGVDATRSRGTGLRARRRRDTAPR